MTPTRCLDHGVGRRLMLMSKETCVKRGGHSRMCVPRVASPSVDTEQLRSPCCRWPLLEDGAGDRPRCPRTAFWMRWRNYKGQPVLQATKGLGQKEV